MKDNLTLQNILAIYEEEIAKNVKNKRRVYNFEINKMQNISNIINMLNHGLVGHGLYNIFLIYEPKCRLVMSLSVKDKIINHFITRYCLEKNLTKYLDDRNCATRKNMGTDYAIRKIKKFLEENKRYEKVYALKLDIKKYFYTIDHEILKGLLKEKMSDFEYKLIEKIIDSTNESYVNATIEKIIDGKDVDVSFYKYGKGLPIGNMTSQFLSIFYLYKLDHYIVHDLRLKYYVRYMDDFIIFSHDLEKLKNAKTKIKDILEKDYKLKLHEKKSFIVNIKEGFSFLGYNFKVIDNKTIIKLKRSNIEKVKRRIKKVKYELKNNNSSHNRAFCSIMTYQYGYKFCDNIRIKNLIDRYFYNEE